MTRERIIMTYLIGLFWENLHDGFLEEWLTNAPFVIVIPYTSKGDFL